MESPMSTGTSLVRGFRRSSFAWGLSFFAFDLLGWAACVYAITASGSAWQQFAWSLAAGLGAGGLVVVAHDACHQALTPSRRLNRIIGTIAFLPAVHAWSLWRHGHNFLHHLHTNQRGKDYVWEPLSPAEYRSLPLRQRLTYRFYRSLIGHLFYYPCDIWVLRRYIPRRRHLGTISRENWVDFGIVTAWLIALCTVVVRLRAAHVGVASLVSSDTAFTLFCAVFMPFLLNGMLMSHTTYLQHTHPAIHWSRQAPAGTWESHQVEVTVHVRYPEPIDWVLHWIMDHTAHHCQPSIPMYRLAEAQQVLEEVEQERVVTYDYTPAQLLRILRACRLYDDERGCWTDYHGNPTSACRVTRAAA